MAGLAVLLMAHGAPTAEEDIEAYLRNIRAGRQPSPGEVQELRERYQKIGGRSPLLDITRSQASALEKNLSGAGLGTRVYVGMKYWHPYVRDLISQIYRDGFRRVLALVMTPLSPRPSIMGYRQALCDAREVSQGDLEIHLIESWYDHSLLHTAVAEKISRALKQFPGSAREKVEVVFTAHSLPQRILELNDPYPEQFHAFCRAVADLSRIDRWSLAYQSAGRTDGKWLRPSIQELLEELSRDPDTLRRNVLIVPIGFVADHLEVLYDLDIEAQAFSTARGLTLKRTESLNASRTFISALADIVVDNCQRN